MTARGRRKYEPDKRKSIELLGGDQYELLRDVLAHPEVASDGHKVLPQALAKAPLGKQAERDRAVTALNRFRAARNEADDSPFYPRPLGEDARRAIQEARAVIKMSKRWIDATAKGRIPRGKKQTKGAQP